MRVIFLPAGGFNKNGAFIEVPDGKEPTDKEPEYERQGYLNVSLSCTDIRVSTNIGVKKNAQIEEGGKNQSEMATRISAIGQIEGDEYDRYSLSFLGQKSEHHRISVSIREAEGRERSYAAGFIDSGEFDEKSDESFFVEMVVTPDRMKFMLSELQKPGAVLKVVVSFSRFRGFYATWSPSVREGRTIKFLNNDRDVENAEEIPKDFNTADFLDYDGEDEDTRDTVQIWLGRSLTTSQPVEVDDEGSYTQRPFVQTFETSRSSEKAIAAAAKQIKRGITMLSVAIIVAAALVALG